MRKSEDYKFKFDSTGREFYAYDHTIGIDDTLTPSYGSDGYIEIDYEELEQEEKKELALHMIELWKKFGGLD